MSEAAVPMLAYWMGKPVHELERDQLHAAFSHVMAENERLRQDACDRSVAEIHRLADLARATKPHRYATVIRNTHLAVDPKARWKDYFRCLSEDEASGIQTTDDERRRFMDMWDRGTVVWRDDGSLMRSAGVTPNAVPDAVLAP